MSEASVGDRASASEPDEPSGDGLLGAVVRLNLALTHALEGITGGHGIPLPDYLVLGVIRGGTTAPGAIAEELGRTTGGMSLTLDRLAAAGWVERAKDPADGRRVIVTLTPAGRELATTVNAELHAWEERLALADDPSRVRGVVDDLTRALREAAVLSGR